MKLVDRVAELVLDMVRGTMKGPTRLDEPFSRTRSAASTWSLVDGPPEPMINPVRSFEISASSSPASAIASAIATWL